MKTTTKKPRVLKSRPLDPWGSAELASFLRKMVGTLFRVGDLQESKDGVYAFWALLPDEEIVRMARITVAKDLKVTVQVRGAEGKKIETLLQENLRATAAEGRSDP